MTEKREEKIGIIGLGAVGDSLKRTLEVFFKEVIGYDTKGNHDWQQILDCRIAFICVPTDGGDDGRLNCSIVEEVLTKLENDGYNGIVAIKSTLRVGFMAEAVLRHPNLRLVYNPEFLREKNALEWTRKPDRIVVAGEPEDTEEVLSVFSWAKKAKRIKTDYISAEFGKLDHNEFIAAKVSFTNETERICEELGANAKDVMDIITADRRVKSKQHLRPYMGPYGGKCVPKDTNELITVTKSELFKVIEKVNDEAKLRYKHKLPIDKSAESPIEPLRIVVIIPTKNRLQQLEHALQSVLSQTRLPDEIVIVGEKSTNFQINKEMADLATTKTRLRCILNERTSILSGAINTAVQLLINEGKNPVTTYLAILDDDDSWEPEYLQTVQREADLKGSHLVVSGIIRHETREDKGLRQTIPKHLTPNMFLTGNPHIQGSNLFVKMSAFLEAGGFDENLPSTTDRDFMIRLLDLGTTRDSCVPQHLVHHYADSSNRLSTYGSNTKLVGLTRFQEKHGPRMTQEEQTQFRQRAKKLFGWTENPENTSETHSPKIPALPSAKDSYKFHLVVGFTASYISCATKLLQDLKDFQKTFPCPISLVILDNTEAPQQLAQLITANKSGFSNVKVVSKTEVERDADAGKLGTYYTRKERRKEPSYGRTALHRFLYLTGLELDNPVFWILDDDVRLDNMNYASNYKTVSPAQFKQIVDYLLENRIAICIGGVMGDPPLPIASSIRGQLLELYYYLSRKTSQTAPRKTNLDAIAAQFPDQYYDLSISHYDHLETPVRTSTNNKNFDISQALAATIEGRNQLRHVLAHTKGNLMRGGNTIVTDIECLRTHINSSPRINGIELRRGDTSWVELNRYIGGELVGRENKHVISLPLFVRQERAPTFKPKLLSDSLAADLLGGAFVRAFTNLIKEKSEAAKKTVDIGTILTFSEEDCQRVFKETSQNLEQRISILVMDAWRIIGLISAIQNQIANANETIANSLNREETKVLNVVLDWIKHEMLIPRVTEFCNRLKIGLNEGITQYLLEFEKSRRQFASNLGLEATDKQKKMAQQMIQRHFGAVPIELIGQGQEGIVFSDGTRAYKYFINDGVQRKDGLLDLVREKLNPSSGLKRIATVENLIVEKNQVLLVSPFIEGSHYEGGRITELLELLQECKKAGLVTTNLWPKNLIVGKNGLVYVDIGRSIVPYTEALFHEMCKRAYLTYRWHFRSDLKELLARSLKESSMPELTGFEEFRKAVEQHDIHIQMDSYLIQECLKSKPKRVLDYGCGAGSIADKLAEYGCNVDCYDPDPTRFCGRPHKPNVILLTEEDLHKKIMAGLGYDLVICNIVLCSIESETEVEQVTYKLRKLTSQGGRVIIGLCNPLSDEVKTSPSQIRATPPQNNYHNHYAITETTLKGNQRTDWHRSISWYLRIAHKASLELEETIEVPSVDVERLAPSSDQILLMLHPLSEAKQAKTVSLMIKASAMEWQTIEKQVKHIVSQLEGPQQFIEKILVTDSATEGFARQYATANLGKFHLALQNLLQERFIDRVVSAPTNENEIKQIYQKWFGVECSNPRACNGQPIFTTLYGLEHCTGEYVLQTDSDCIYFRRSRNHDYINGMIEIMEKDQTAVTVALPITYEKPHPYAKADKKGKQFRVEVRCCLLNMTKLKLMLPLENETQNDQLKLPWHRSLDIAIQKGKATSYRGGNPQTCFVHIPDFRKTDINDWMSIIDAAEAGTIIPEQLNRVELVGEAADWLGKRNEPMIILMRGKDVPLSKVRRCIESLQAQSFKDWAAIIIDAASSNGTEELYKHILKQKLGDKATFVHNHIPVNPMENIDYATSSICTNSESIIVHLDLDDVLIGTDALSKVKEAYDKGADVTVGSMLRTDKQQEYPVCFDNPRANRGGNVWQHLRTYKKCLYDNVPKEYFQIDGEWVKHSEDWAFMIPIVELARNPAHIKDKIYLYEPSENKPNRNIQERETMIAKLIAKPSLEEST